MAPQPAVSRVSTESVAPQDRTQYWEHHLRRDLVDLTCSSYSERGLIATMTDVRLGELHVFEIRANAHAVQRTPAHLRSGPSDSIFVNVILRGSAAFLDSDVFTAAAGDAVIYDSDLPYLQGYPDGMHHLLLRIPCGLFAQRAEYNGHRVHVASSSVLGRNSPAEAVKVAALSEALHSVISGPSGRRDAASLQDALLDLTLSLMRGQAGGAATESLWVARRIAHDYIDRHLDESGLSPGKVAASLGVSMRHLRRIFEIDGVPPARFILERRLGRARELLTDPEHRSTTIADVAYRCGFASHAHFSRVFRDQSGMTPRRFREREDD